MDNDRLSRRSILVTLGNPSFFPADFGLAPNIDAARPSPQFYAPGTIIDAEILQPEHPLFYGSRPGPSRCAMAAARS